jgi:hypothetical protein
MATSLHAPSLGEWRLESNIVVAAAVGVASRLGHR